MHLTSNPIDWYAARAGGVVAYVLLTTVVAVGLGLAGKPPRRRWPKFAVQDVHRFGGLLVGAFVVIHIVAIAIDSFLPFSLVQIALPFVSSYRPIWVGLGIVAAELLLALSVTNRFRDRLPYRFWRRAHYLNFAVWIAATVHGIGSGTDRSTPWLVAIFALATATVVTLTLHRALRGRLGEGVRLRAGSAAVGFGAAALVAFLALGPLSFHARVWNAASFHDRLAGQILVQRGVGKGIMSMAGEGQGLQRVLVRADLLVDQSGLRSTSFQLEYVPSGTLCKGRVTVVHAYSLRAVCNLPNGSQRIVEASWAPAPTSTFHGQISAHA